MYKIAVTRTFAGAHYLKGYLGKCENLHGHNWKVVAVFSCEKLDEIGIAIDFKIATQALDSILNELDHTLLNNHSAFKKTNPSAENIAKYIFKKLSAKIQKKAKVKSVTVWESENHSAEYSED
jgi:6-pyruvoyltetrahydropterin/6-carboxytetrahydropterin synthase